MGWTEEKNNTAFLHRATAKSEKLKLEHSITEMVGPPEPLCSTLDAFFLNFCKFCFPNRTRDFVALTFLTECNLTALTPHYLPTGSATIPVPQYVNTGNTPRLAPHYLNTYPRAALQHYLVLFYPSPFCKAWGFTEKRCPSENNIKK